MNPLKQLRAARVKALADGTAAPVAFFWEDPELLTVEGSDGVFQIYFTDMIDDWFGISASMVVEALLTAGDRDVLVHMNCPGGMVTEGLAIHSAFKQYAGKVTFRVEGMAASAASFVILAGDVVEIEPAAMIMIHDAWDVTVGPASEHRKTADLLDKVSDSIAGMYAEKAGGTRETWRASMIEETWYSGQEAVDAGLADTVVEPKKADSKAAADPRWRNLFSSAPRAATDWGTDPAPEPPAEPVVPPTPPAPEPEPVIEPTVLPEPPDLAQLLAGVDLSAAMRNAFPSRGVPA